MFARAWVAAALATSGLLHTAIAAADSEKADLLFRQGRQALEVRDYSRACRLLEQSFAEDPGPTSTLLNLAYCHQMIARRWQAYLEYGEVARRAPTSERRSFAERSRKEVERLLPRFELQQLPDGPVVSTVKLDDGSIVEDPSHAFPVEPGMRTLTLLAPGQPPRILTVNAPDRPGIVTIVVARADEPARVTASPAVSESPAPTVSTTVDVARASTLRTAGIVSIAVGVVALGLGTYFGLESFAIRDSACPSEACPGGGVYRIQGAAMTTAMLSTLSFGIGVTTTLGGGLLLLTQRPPASY